MTDLSQYSDEELERIAAGASASPSSFQTPVASAQAPTAKPLSEWTDEELEAYVAQSQGQGPTMQPAQESAQPTQAAQATPRKMTQEERIAQYRRAIARAQESSEGPGFWRTTGEAALEGAKGLGRGAKAFGESILGMATSVLRLNGTPTRMLTGWDGIHRLADKIDESYANFGRDALMSEYGENPDGWGYALGRAGEKVLGVVGSLAAFGGAGKVVQAASGAAKMAGLARTEKVVENALPLMFGNDAAVRAYDTARANGKSKGEAAALAGLNGAIHFFGFKAFENQSLKKMLNIGPEVEVMMPKWANALANEGGQSFSSLVRGTRNGMVKYIAAERGKGALKAGGIMGLQNMLSDPVMQVAEGADIDDIDFSRMLKAGAHGVGEGALMEGLMGGAAIFKSQKAAEKFMADKFFRGKDYKVMGADGKMHDEPGVLNTPQGRMLLMKQNPDATTRVLDIVDHGGKPRPEELDAAFLPSDMTAEELRKFHDDWRKDLLNNMGIDPDAQPAPRLGYQINVGERPPAQEWQGAENPGIAFDELVRRGTAGQGRPEASPETTTQERPNETGNGADEAPAQPEQGAVQQPQEGEVGKAETPEPPRAEAPDAGVVEPPVSTSEKISPTATEKTAETAEPVKEAPKTNASLTTPAQPAENGPTTAPKPTEAQTQTPAKPAEGVETPSRPSAVAAEGAKEGASDATPAVSAPDKASDAQKAALAKLGEGEGVAVTSAKMGKGGVLRVKYTMPSADGRVVEFDSTIDAEGKTSTSVAGVKATPAPAAQTGEVSSPETPAPTPAPATQDQTNIPNEKNSSPAPAPKSNRLRRADGTDPLAEREQAAVQSPESPAPTGAEPPAPVSRTVRGNLVEKRLRPILDLVRNEDGSFNPDALRNHDGNNGLPLKDLKLLNEHPEIVDDLGLPAEDAAALKSALTEAYNTQRVATPNSKEGKVSEAGQANYSVSASKALERLAKHPNNPKVFAIAQQQVSAALEAAKRQTDENGRKNEQSISFWQERLDELNTKFDALPKETQGAILRQAQSLQGKLQAAERKERKSNTTAEGEELDIADEGRDMGEDNVMSDEQANAEYGDEARFARAAASETKTDTENEKNSAGILRDTDKDLGRRGIQLETKNGKVNVVWRNEMGDVVRRAPLDMLEKAAKKDPTIKDLIEKLKQGEQIRAAKSSAADLPDAWTPETQKPLERVAHALRNVVTVGGKKIKVLFVPRPKNADGDTRKSIVIDEFFATGKIKEAESQLENFRYMKNAEGKTVGEYDAAKGEIRLYPGARVADVVHEFTHPLVDFARAEAKAGRGEFLNKIKAIIDAERETWEQPIRDAYSDKGEEEILEEIFTHAMGEKGAKLFGKSTNTLQGRQWYRQLWEKIKGLWQDFATKMGWNKADLRGLERMSPEDAARHILSEMAKGRSFGDAKTDGEGTRNVMTDSPPAESQGGVRESRRVVLPGNPAKPTTDLIDEKRTKGERLQEGVQDKDIAIRNVQDELGGIVDKQTASGHTDAKTTFKKDGTVDKLGSTDVYSAKMRANGHLQAGFNEIEAGQRRIDKTLADNGITPEEFGKFLYAEHAPERNQTIAERKAEDADKATWRKARAEAAKGNTAPLDALRKAVVVDPANKEYSGMSNDEARAYLASSAVAAKRAALDSAANELYRMQRQNLDRLLESGRISKDFHDLLTTRWKKYVPLRTDVEGKDGAAYNLSVGGFRQNEFMTAEGRKSLADSPYAFAMLQVQQGLRGAEANTINLTAANLVRYAESLGHHIGDIMQGKEAGRGKGWTFKFADGDTVQVGGDMKLAKNRNDIILFKENGELKAIRMVKGAEGRGEALADAITGRNVRQWHKDLSFLPRWTRFLSAMRTQYSPEFIFSNALADHMESTQALVGRYGIKDGLKLAGKALAWEVRNRKDLRRYIKTGDPGTGYVKEAIDAGVLIKGGVAAQGYSGELKNIESNYEKFVRDAKGFGKMSAKEKASFVWDGLKNFISNTNELIENSTRIGIYSALREQGVSKADAVKFAREATVDFNRKGTYTPWINGLYMFSNASVQGALRSVQAMGDAHGKQLVGLLVAAGVAKAVLDHYLGNDDEREKAGGRNARNLSEYDKKHKLGVPIGGSKQFTGIRMRGPYAAIPYLAQTFTNVALGETSVADAAKTVVRELTDQATDLVSGNGAFKDNGEFDGALLGQSFAPTLADPLVQLYSGKDYKGDERRRKTSDKTMPLSSNGKRSTSDWYKGAAEGLNWLTGGNANRKGIVDVAPEDLQLVVEFLAGGVGRDIHNVIATGKNIAQAASGGTPERTLSQTPFLRTLVNEYPENTSRYFDALEDYEADKAEFKKTTDPERRRELRADKPYLFAGKSLLDGQIDRVKELMHLERGEVKVGQKWVEPKIERTEEQKEKYRKQRLALQARILKRLGK